MSQWLRQGTAAVVTFGPFLAKGNGVTVLSGAGIITSIDHATTGILLSKNGGAATIRHQAVSPSTYDAHGFFKVTLDVTDTATPGTLLMMHSEPATYLSVWRVFMVIPAQVWDSLFGSDKLDVSVVEQANIDFGALQKASITAAVPGVAAIQSGLATATALGVVDGLVDAIKATVDAYLDAAISNIPVAPTAVSIREEMDDHSTKLSAIVSAVAPDGSSTYTDNVLDLDLSPLEGVQIEAYSNAGRTVLVDVQETDVNGSFTMHLNPGTYYMRAVKVGYSFTDWTKVVT
jgi:hypothetical protein